jgi:hypothetical protein
MLGHTGKEIYQEQERNVGLLVEIDLGQKNIERSRRHLLLQLILWRPRVAWFLIVKNDFMVSKRV